MHRLKDKGFTMVETMVTIAIFSLVIGATMGFITISYKTYGFSWQQSVAINEARKGIETMVKEIREARTGDDGSYPIEKARDKEFIFFSDIDKDEEVERVRYFLGTTQSGNLSQDCVTFIDGGSCVVSFSDFLSGTLESAEVEVSVEGDFGWAQEYAEVYADGILLEDDICKTGCSDCAGTWQGTAVFDVTDQALDNSIQFLTDSNSQVNDFCDWEDPNHAMKVNIEFSWTETLAGGQADFKKGVISPVGDPAQYLEDQEEVSVLSSHVRNSPPIFKYFDGEGNRIEDDPSRLIDTKLMEVFLIIDFDPNRPPSPFELISSVQLRNLKSE